LHKNLLPINNALLSLLYALTNEAFHKARILWFENNKTVVQPPLQLFRSKQEKFGLMFS